MDDQLKTLDQIKHTVIDLAIKFGPRVVVAIAFVVFGVVVGHWAGRIADRGFKRVHLEPPVRHLLVRVVWILVFGLFAIMAVQNLGIELLPLIAGLGVAGAGVALAMQGMLGNLVAGLTVIFTKPFSVGEYISITGEEGRVENISLFTTTLSHADLSLVIIPNRKVVGEILHNYGSIRQIDVTVSIAHGADLDGVLALVGDVVRQCPLTLKDPAPVIAVNAVTSSAIEIAVRPWANVPDYCAAASEIRRMIVAVFRGKHIAMPVQMREIRLLGEPEAERI